MVGDWSKLSWVIMKYNVQAQIRTRPAMGLYNMAAYPSWSLLLGVMMQLFQHQRMATQTIDYFKANEILLNQVMAILTDVRRC